MPNNLDDLSKKIQEAINIVKTEIPDIVGVEAVNHYKQSFHDEGFTNTNLEKWKPRVIPKSTKILTGDKGDSELGDSIDYEKSSNSVSVFTDKDYAQIHNEGGEITVTTKMKKFFWYMYLTTKEEYWKGLALKKTGSVIVIPQRQFIGPSEVLVGKWEDKISRRLDETFNS